MIITAEGPKSNSAGQSRGQHFRHGQLLTGSEARPAMTGVADAATSLAI